MSDASAESPSFTWQVRYIRRTKPMLGSETGYFLTFYNNDEDSATISSSSLMGQTLISQLKKRLEKRR